MNSSLSRWAATAFVIGLIAILSSGCIVTGGGYGYDGGAGYGLDYYEPYGVAIGGWGPGYQVAPYRERGQRPAFGGGRPAVHAYRAAPTSRTMPSIPSGSHSGRGGGGGHR